MTKEKRNRPTTGDSPLKMGSLWIQAYRLNPSKPSSQESRGFNHGSVNFLAESSDGHDSSCFWDFAGQKEILEQDRGLPLYCFLRNVAPSSATIHLFLLSNRLFRRLLRPSECVLRSIA